MTTLVGAAHVLGGYVWLERRLFEILGGWVPFVAEPEVKLRMAADSHHHAWHASLWTERLPVLREMDAEEFVVPASDALAAFIAALASSATTLEKLVAVYRVALPRQVGAYSHHLARTSAITDGPTIRALELILADDLADWRTGELLIQSVMAEAAGTGAAGTAGTHPAAAAAAHQGRLEGLLVSGGGGRESNPPDEDHPSQPL